MKILHTGDWQLGHRFNGFVRQDEHAHFLHWLQEIIVEREIDAVIVCGNVFDSSMSSSNSLKLLNDFFQATYSKCPGIQMILTSGKQDAHCSLGAYEAILEKSGIVFRWSINYDENEHPLMERMLIPLRDRQENGEVKAVVMALPYLQHHDCNTGEPRSHAAFRMAEEMSRLVVGRYGRDIPQLLMGNDTELIDAPWPSSIAYIALGGSQKAETRDRISYAGGVIPMNFMEQVPNYGVNLLTLEESGKILLDRIEYVPPRKFYYIVQAEDENIDNVAENLKKIAKEGRNKNELDCPYVKIAVNENNSIVLHKLLKVVGNGRMRLCGIVKKGQQKWTFPGPDDRRLLNPAMMARVTYKKLYGEEMSDEIALLFAQAKRENEKI